MKLITRDDLIGECEACGSRIHFSLRDDGDVAYYEADEVVNLWVDHQLNDCKTPVIDNPGGIS